MKLEHTLNFMDDNWYRILPIDSRIVPQVILLSDWEVDSTACRAMS